MRAKPEPTETASPPPAEERRGMAGPRAVADFTTRLTRKPLGKRGFAEATLVAEWPTIVGGRWGEWTLPLKIVFPPGERSGGTLHLRVASGGIATQVQHQHLLILQRINGHFGYGAVAKLSIHQGPIPLRRKAKPVAPGLPPEKEKLLADKLAGVDDPELREALARLGRRLG